MPPLPLSLWLGIGALLLVLAALCAGTLYAVLRAPARRRIAAWPGSRILLLLVACAVPWIIIKVVPLTISASIHGIVLPVLWSLGVLLAFGVLVLFPIGTVACALVWWLARRRASLSSHLP